MQIFFKRNPAWKMKNINHQDNEPTHNALRNRKLEYELLQYQAYWPD